MQRRVIARMLLVVVAAGRATIAHAEDRALAERFYRLGEMAYATQNFDAAAQNFEEAYAHFALPEIAFSAAQSYRRLFRIDGKAEHVQRAVALYRAYLDKVKVGGRVADAADSLAEMQYELDKLIAAGAQVSPQVAKERTRIIINPSLGKEPRSASLTEVKESTVAMNVVAQLDGATTMPFAPIQVEPGVHRIRVTAPGYVARELEKSVPQGTTVIVDAELEPRPARVGISTLDDARILLDGRPVGTSPLVAFEVPAGRHLVSILHRGRRPIVREIEVARGEQVLIDAPLEMTPRRRTVPWLLAGAGLAVGVGITSGIIAYTNDREGRDILNLDIRTTGDASRAELEAYRDAVRWRDRGVAGMWLAGGTAIALTGLAALLYYTDNPQPDRVRIEPMATPEGGGAAIAGRF